MMKRFLFLLLCLMPVSYAAEEPIMVLDAEFWFMPRTGAVVAEHYGVRAAVNKLIAEPDAYLALRYPDNEAGELWGLELQAWLVSLGIVSDRIELQAGYDRLEGVALVVIAPDKEVEESLSVVDMAVDVNEVVEDDVMPVVEAVTDMQFESELVEESAAQKDVVLEEQVELKQE